MRRSVVKETLVPVFIEYGYFLLSRDISLRITQGHAWYVCTWAIRFVLLGIDLDSDFIGLLWTLGFRTTRKQGARRVRLRLIPIEYSWGAHICHAINAHHACTLGFEVYAVRQVFTRDFKLLETCIFWASSLCVLPEISYMFDIHINVMRLSVLGNHITRWYSVQNEPDSRTWNQRKKQKPIVK